MTKNIKQREPIALRTKALKGGRQSLYLDTYVEAGRTHSYEFLKLYLIPERSAQDREQNANTMQCARAIQAQRLMERAQGKAGIKPKKDNTMLLSDYLRNLAEIKAQQGQSDSNANIIKQMHAHLQQYHKRDITLSKIDKAFCLGFIDYLSTATQLSSKHAKVISKNTAMLYYTVFTCALNDAVKDGYITSNPANQVKREEKKPIKAVDKMRDYLTEQEVKMLINAKCGSNDIKRAFLFACFCGLRISDIEALTWGNIQEDKGQYFANLTMTKTRKALIVPLGANALQWLPERKSKSRKIFNLPYKSSIARTLARWTERAGIEKHVTFHTSRHTFATLLLTQGADLYTTSKLLGHTNITTTQVYADIINEKKTQAINLLDNIKL